MRTSTDVLASMFGIDCETLARRQLSHALGVAAVGAARPLDAFGQGQCGGARAGTAACDTMPA
jgi:hypothetical protein